MKRWRLIFSGAHDGFFNMALDEALLLSCQRGLSPPILRLYLWDPPAVSIGYSQAAEKAVDLGKCQERKIQVVRRITGGRAVLHEAEMTYGLCASTDGFPELGGTTAETYRKVSMALVESLKALGVKAQWVRPSSESKSPSFKLNPSKPCFVSNSRYEITVDGRKLVGSAQRRFCLRSDGAGKESFLQHGSILTHRGKHSLAELMPGGDCAAIHRSLTERSTDLESVLGSRVSRPEMILAMRTGFEKTFGCAMEYSVISEKELGRARCLRQQKYSDPGWNLHR